MSNYIRILLVILLSLTSAISAQKKRSLTIEDLWNMKRIGDLQLSADGKTLAFTVTSYNMETNKGNTDIYLINSDGSNLRVFQGSEVNESEPRFHPDGQRISYAKNDQIYIADFDGKNEAKLTDLYTGVSGHEWSNDGSKILFRTMVYPECEDQECNKKIDEEKAKDKVKAKIFTELLYRHWNDWRGEKRSRLFIYDLNQSKYFDLSKNPKRDVPPIALGSSNDYNFSPDGKEVAYVQNLSDFEATSTNNDVFIVNVDTVFKGGAVEPLKISKSEGTDIQPVYSPDGQFIAFQSMERAGFEADKKNIILFDRATGALNNLTEKFNRSPGTMVWSPDSKYIFFDAANETTQGIYKLNLEHRTVELIGKLYTNSIAAVSPDSETIYFLREKSTLPKEIFSMNIHGGEQKQISKINEKLLSEIAMQDIETFWCEGADGDFVNSIILRPPHFDPNKKYPLVFLIHGGPQGHWNDEFHYRWNLQMFASPGYVVVAPNPRGSVGYGQEFTDEISKDWGGKVYTDLMKTLDYALETYPFIDSENIFSAGASYGGYMINWLAGQTDRFNALVSHAGVFNLESMYGTTEELWFPEWEFGGVPWENRELYKKWSPHNYVQNYSTPMLVIHGAFDFRVPEEQAFQLFTTLQRLGIKSKFLYYPDETHFVSKPQNARLWWNTIYDWFNDNKK